MANGLVWKDDYRDGKVRFSVRRVARCACGMMVEADVGQHGQLFGAFCTKKPTRGPWRYHSAVYVGGIWVLPETLPPDIAAEVNALRREAGANRRSTWARYEGGKCVARWNRK